MKRVFYFLLIIIFFMALAGEISAEETGAESNLDKYVQDFYDRYSRHFDDFGLVYASPTYGIKDFKRPEKSREWMALSSYYKYRALAGEKEAAEIIEKAIIAAYHEISNNSTFGGFEAAEANFLAIRLLETNPKLLDAQIRNDILKYIKNNLIKGAKVKDNDNRGIIAAAHWQYANNYLFKKGLIDVKDKEEIDKVLKKRMDTSIAECINKDYWYLENKKRVFSPHYQAASALMLLAYGDLIGEDHYLRIAEEMYYNLKKVSFKNGMVEAKLGQRPIGLGAQFYLAQALLGKYFKDDDYRVYLFYGSGNRFFSDRAHPDRLEFHSTIEGSALNFHDDYAFSDVAEMGLLIPSLQKIDLRGKIYFEKPIKESRDGTFKIKNNGKEIIINDRKNILGSYGNWSTIVKIKN